MKFAEYKEQVKRTLPHLGEWYGNPIILDSLHCLVGVKSEHYELVNAIVKNDVPNIGEEITDKAWYATNFCNVRNITPSVDLQSLDSSYFMSLPDAARQQRIISASNQLNLALSELQDYDKKEWAYRKPATEAIHARRIELINIVLNRLNDLYALNDLDAEKCMEQNINKLKARFPDKFDMDKANNRDLETERKTLEN